MPITAHHYNNYRDADSVHLEPEEDDRLDETIEKFLNTQGDWGHINEDDEYDDYDESIP